MARLIVVAALFGWLHTCGGLVLAPIRQASDGCANLMNHGSYFTTTAKVGTPAQEFDVIADTGSNAFVIPSCACQQSGSCPSSDRCFRDSASSSIHRVTNQTTGEQVRTRLTYGSGDLQGIVVQDVLKVGDISQYMDGGLVLMESRALQVKGSFEGILGLGLPNSQAQGRKGVLEQSETWHFSLCFKRGQNGVLRVGAEHLGVQHGSLGQVHWGVGFEGITVGNAAVPLEFCQTTIPGALTSCGAIPDSGTTLIMGPTMQIQQLWTGICQGWDRCMRHPVFDNKPETKFISLLRECGHWQNPHEVLAEMPDLKFHITGASGSRQVLTIPATAYVLSANQDTESVADHAKMVLSILNETGASSEAQVPLSDFTGACMPAFGSLDYLTKLNGPVWILGTPLFYEHVVTYHMDETPPTISFSPQSETPCGSCDDFERMRDTALAGPLPFHGVPRMPNIDITLPL